MLSMNYSEQASRLNRLENLPNRMALPRLRGHSDKGDNAVVEKANYPVHVRFGERPTRPMIIPWRRTSCRGPFHVSKPNEVWATDITYIRTWEGGCTWRS